jgi:hypothetical protein
MSDISPQPPEERPDQIKWERNPRGCSRGPVGCMYVAVAFFFVLLVVMLFITFTRTAGAPGGMTP